MSRNRFRALLFLAIGLSAYFVVAACSGDDNSPTRTTAQTGQTTQATSGGNSTVAATPNPTNTGALAGNRTVEVVKQGYHENIASSFNSFGCGVLLHNKSTTEGVVQADWNVNFYDASGAKVGGTYGYIYNLLPGETRGDDSCGGQTDPANAVIARMETTIHVCPTCWEPVTTTKRFSTTVTALDKSNATTYKGTGTATNPFSKDLPDVRVEILYYNAAGEILGSGGAHFDTVAAGQTVNWDAQVYVDFADNSAIDHIEAFVAPSSITHFTDLQ